MAQHDYVIANASGATVRADINNMALAISSNNSGSSAPSTTYAYLWWIDTGNNLLKLRNSANNAWITMPFSITANNTVDINGGNIDGAVIGGSSAAAGTFTTFTSNGIDDNADATAITIGSDENVTFTKGGSFADVVSVTKAVGAGSGITNFLTLAATDGGVNMSGGEGAGIMFKIPDDETNPSVGARIAGIKESADDSVSNTALIFEVTQNDETPDEAMRIASDRSVQLPDSGKLQFGASQDLNLYHDGSDSYITDTGSGNLLIQYSDLYFSKDAGSSHMVRFHNSGDVTIGTTSASSAKLAVAGDVRVLNDGKLMMRKTDTYILSPSNDELAFYTGAGQRMHINSSGHVKAPGLNTTGSTSNRYPLYWVHTGTTGNLEPYTGSVRAMKTDIADMGSVDWIHSLTPRSFKFRDYTTDSEGNRTYLETTNDLPNTEYGLIAEEVDTVSGSDYILDKDASNNLKGVLYHNLVPILLKAVQELKTDLDAAKARITTLEG